MPTSNADTTLIFGIAQIILAAIFLISGVMKIIRSREKLLVQKQMAWVNDFSQQQVHMIGAVELLAALFLIGGSIEWLSEGLWFAGAIRFAGVAGLVLFCIMCGAAFTHTRRKEDPMIALNVVLALLAIYVFWVGVILA